MAFPSTTTEFVLSDSRLRTGVIVLPATIQNPGRILTIKDFAGSFQRSSIEVFTSGIDADGNNQTDFFENGSYILTLSNNYDTTQLFTPSQGIWYTIGGNYLNSIHGELTQIGQIRTIQTANNTLSLASTLTSTLTASYINTLLLTTSTLQTAGLIGPATSTQVSTFVSWSSFVDSFTTSNISTVVVQANSIGLTDLSTVFVSASQALISSIDTNRFAQSTLIFPSFPRHYVETYIAFRVPDAIDAYIDSVSSSLLSTQSIQAPFLTIQSGRTGIFSVPFVSSTQYQSLRGNVSTFDVLRYASPRFRTETLWVDSLSTVRFVSASRLLTGQEIVDPQFQTVSTIRYSTNSLLTLSASVQRFSSFQGQISDLVTGYFFTDRLELITLSSFTMAPNRAVVSTFQTNLVSTVNLASRITTIQEIYAENFVGRSLELRVLEANEVDALLLRASDVEYQTVSTARLSTSLVQADDLYADYMAASTFVVSSVVADFFYTISLVQRTFSTVSFSTNRLETRELDIDVFRSDSLSTQRTFLSSTQTDSFITRTLRYPSLSTIQMTGVRIDSSDFEFLTMSTTNISSASATIPTVVADTVSTFRTNQPFLTPNDLSSFSFIVQAQMIVSSLNASLFVSTRTVSVDQLTTVRHAVQLGVVNTLSTLRLVAANAFIQTVDDITTSSFRFLASDLETDLLSTAVLSTGVLSLEEIPMDTLFTRTNFIPFLSSGTIYNRDAAFLQAQALVETSTTTASILSLNSYDLVLGSMSVSQGLFPQLSIDTLFLPRVIYSTFSTTSLTSVRLNTVRFEPSTLVAINVSSVRGFTGDISANIMSVRQRLDLLNYPETVFSTNSFQALRWTASNLLVSTLSSVRTAAQEVRMDSIILNGLTSGSNQMNSLSTTSIVAFNTTAFSMDGISSVESTRVSSGIFQTGTVPDFMTLSTVQFNISQMNGLEYVPFQAQLLTISSLLSTATLTTSSISFVNIKPQQKIYVIGGQKLVAAPNSLAFSPDGSNWTLVPGANLFSGQVNDIAHNGRVWVVVGIDTANSAYWSEDLLTWTGSGIIFTVLSGTTRARTIATNGIVFVMGSERSPFLVYSFNGKTWTTATGVTTTIYKIVWNGKIFVAVGQSGTSSIYYSSNGINWTVASHPFVEGNLLTLVSNGKLWLTGIGELIGSYDGITWFRIGVTSLGTNVQIDEIAWNGNYFLLNASRDSFAVPTIPNASFISLDGFTWTAVQPDALTRGFFNTSSWNGSQWVVGGQTYRNLVQYAVSPDAVSWTFLTSTVANFLSNVTCFGWNSNFIPSYNDSNLLIFPEDIAWYPSQKNTILPNISSLTFNNTMTVDAQSGRVRIVSVYPSSILSTQVQYTLDVVGNAKFSTLALGTFDSFSTFGPSASNIRLSISDGDAYKATANWLITSDTRLKENVLDAQLDLCYDTIKQLPLRRFAYKTSFVEATRAYDVHTLGFLAQEVSTILPKAITSHQGYGLPNLQTLNVDQIHMAQLGALQKVIYDSESIQSTAFSLLTSSEWITARVSTMEGYVASLGNNV